MSENSQVVYPIAANERIYHLDVIRGIALLGILLANMSAFSFPVMYAEAIGMDLWSGGWDQFAGTFVDWFVQGKFYTMFSFLFGLGFMIFLTKAEEKGYRPKRLFARRLTVLLAIGLLHAMLVWWGDILVTYACCGFLLLWFYRLQAKNVLMMAYVLFGLGILQIGLLAILQYVVTNQDPDLFSDASFGYLASYQTAYDVYSSGTWSQIIAQNIADWGFTLTNITIYPFIILPMFLLGVYAYKRGVVREPAQHLPWIRQVWLGSLLIGVVFSIVKYVYAEMDGDMAYVGEYIGATFGDASLSIFYMTSIVLLYVRGIGREIFRAIGMAGRMALTNYLMQSLICTFIFYHYGLGLYGLGAGWTMLIAILLYTAQVLLSRLWFMRFNWGPMEWLWRKLTYGKLQMKSGDRS
jgi:uncharacterized protein